MMTCGGETTREDEIIYGEVTGALIDRATNSLHQINSSFPKNQIRVILENLVYRCILEVEKNGPW